ncbi:MAG: M18 family aminopeptidase [Clostridiales bacterium]|nr:M18 family aminopeptidase [Clostridiales bacterium]
MNIKQLNQELFSYIKESPTNYHAVNAAVKILEENGFLPLREQDGWELAPEGKYYITRGGTSLFAFRMPRTISKTPFTFQMIASHSDSPCFKLKEQAEISVEEHYTKLNVERYGGSLMAPWFDRPLSIAGRVVVKDGNKISSRLVNLDRDLAMIVNLAIHMNRTANDGQKYQVQTDLLPLVGSGKKDFSVRKLVAEELQVPETAIHSVDLCLYNRMDGSIWGADNEFISCPRLDDLQCVFASIRALTENVHPQVLSAAVVFDTEEVGSQSRQGACSTFLKDCLERIYLVLGYSREDFLRALAGSFLISADNGHALHPNYPGKSNPGHHPYLNGGVLIKYAANQKYTSDGLTGGIFRMLCEEWDVPCQAFFNHSDEPGGSTLGNLSMSQVSVPTVDIGTPMLGMHSPYETGGAEDTVSLYRAMQAFYQTRICLDGNGEYRLVRE